MSALQRIRYGAIDLLRGTRSFNLVPKLEANLSRSRASILAYTTTQLRQVLLHAQRTTPYYRRVFARVGFDPARFSEDRFDELYRIPILTKDLIIENRRELISTASRQHRPRRMASGGTTGNPLSFLVSSEAYSHAWADCYRQFRIGGWDFGQRMGVFRGDSVNRLGRLENLIYGALNNWLFLDTLDNWDAAVLESYWRKLRNGRLEFIFGYSASIAELAYYLQRTDRSLDMCAAFCTTEVLRPAWRAVIEERFRCKVYDFCQVSDGGFAMFQCQQGSYHISDDIAFVEGIDSRASEVEVTVTSLHNFSMPFIRYRNGDLFQPAGRASCPCGCNFSLIERLIGRKFEYFDLPSGAKAHGAKFGDTLREFSYVKNYQVVQVASDRIALKIEPNRRDHDSEIAFWREMKRLRRRLEGIRLDFYLVDAIAGSTANQKTIPFVTRQVYERSPERFLDPQRPPDRVVED